MTTLWANHRDSFVLVGFLAVVVLGMAVSVGLRGSPVAGIVLAAVAALIIAGGFALGRRPPRELRITADHVELAVGNRSLGRIERAAASGAVRFDRAIHQGRTHLHLAGGGGWSGERLPLDGFDGDAARTALAEHGWYIEADGPSR